MRIKFPFAWAGMFFIAAAVFWLHADLVEMQNGDRYSGKVLSVSTNAVVVESEVLGQITVPRTNVASLAFGTNAAGTKAPARFAPTNPPAAPSLADLVKTNAELSAALRSPGTNLNSITQIREQMLGGNPEAVGKFNELLGGLMSGKLTVDDIRREARSAAAQLRELKRELGPDAAGSFDGYLSVLDHFLKEADARDKTNAPPAPPPQAQTR